MVRLIFILIFRSILSALGKANAESTVIIGDRGQKMILGFVVIGGIILVIRFNRHQAPAPTPRRQEAVAPTAIPGPAGEVARQAALPLDYAGRKVEEDKTKKTVLEARRLIADYRAKHQGLPPSDIAAYFAQASWKPVVSVPPYHQTTDAIHALSSLQDLSSPDTSGWAYVSAPQSKDFGSIFINCTHTDSSGSSWDSY